MITPPKQQPTSKDTIQAISKMKANWSRSEKARKDSLLAILSKSRAGKSPTKQKPLNDGISH